MAAEPTSRIKILTEPASLASGASTSSAPRKVLESLDGFFSYSCDGEDEKRRSYNVIFPQSAYRRVVEHLAEDTTRELGGFLLGYETEIGPDKVPTVVVEEAVPAQFTIGTPVRLTFTTESWRTLDAHTDQMRERGRVLQRVGWYHSHPNISIFLSHWDLDVCKTFDQRQYPIALVVDPVNHRAGFFVATNKIYQAHSPQGFYEVPDLRADPMVTWKNLDREVRTEARATAEARHQTKSTVVPIAGPTGHPAPDRELPSTSRRLPIVLSVLALALSLGAFGVLYEIQRDQEAQLKDNQQAITSLQTGALNLSKSVEAIADNVTDLRASLDKSKGSSAKPIVSVGITPPEVEVRQSQRVAFHAMVSGASSQKVRWAITPSLGTIAQTGVYQAPAVIAKTQNVAVKAVSVSDPDKFGTAAVSLQAQIAVTSSSTDPDISVQITPDHAAVPAGGKQTFTAAVTGTSETAVIWSIEGDGAIQDGEYSAPAVVAEPKTVKIKAASKKDPSRYGMATVELSPIIPAPVPN